MRATAYLPILIFPSSDFFFFFGSLLLLLYLSANTVLVAVVKVCTSPQEAKAAVTALMSPSATAPTLDGVAYPKPRIIVMGGGYAPADFDPIYETVDGAKSVPWIRPLGTKPGGPGLPAGPPPAEEIARRLRKILDDHLEEIREGKGAGEVWWM